MASDGLYLHAQLERRNSSSGSDDSVDIALAAITRLLSPGARPVNGHLNAHNQHPQTEYAQTSATHLPIRPTYIFPNRTLTGPLVQPDQATPRARHVRQITNSIPRYASRSAELKVWLSSVPIHWGTLELYKLLEPYGNIVRIVIHRSANNACVSFNPIPSDRQWLRPSLQCLDIDHAPMELGCTSRIDEPASVKSPTSDRTFPERMSLPLHRLDFGVKDSEASVLVLRSFASENSDISAVALELQKKALVITFSVHDPAGMEQSPAESHHTFRLQINLALLKKAHYIVEANLLFSLVLTIDWPPLLYRKTDQVGSTHVHGATRWIESLAWHRQTGIHTDANVTAKPVQISSTNTLVDVGRWLTYRLVFTQRTVHSDNFKDFCQALADYNVNVVTDEPLEFQYGQPEKLWSWYDYAQSAIGHGKSSSNDLQLLIGSPPQLPFQVQYQLEVCLSTGVLHECSIDASFVHRLATIDPRLGTLLLQKAADANRRIFNPNDVFTKEHCATRFKGKRHPSHCIRIPSVIVTPTTILFQTPILETSNRVIRQFVHYEDRFLRVKFTDERYNGRILSHDGQMMDKIFTRVLRTLTHGINIGDRHYEFLAFGNSQFREHGAYFFASTPLLCAADIRNWMGNFTNINVIAKYASRIGQCFSTTRAIAHSVSIERIPDVKRSGYCFTDGVGKISPFLAQMVAHHFGLDASDTPSVFQFRLAGCKGILAVDPALKARVIQIRPSQEKFPAKYHGLEICRLAHYSTAYLNMQLILVLSARGVRDVNFISKLKALLTDIEHAMANEAKAKDLLQRNVDHNQMTLTLASMISDGFMRAKDPFTMSCLRLWRSWSLKYLKEKARIYIEQGAFVLGTTDETCTLKGHFSNNGNQDSTYDEKLLPEIFIQIPEEEAQGKYTVIEGVCLLARNPSLHPGDIRVVRAVNVPALQHLKNCVVLPQSGDRDLANMCSGGDLDGDDYLVMWDKDMMPPEWYCKPMDYTAPLPQISSGPVEVSDMTKFFVNHIKNDNLGRIATAHRYWADQLREGVKDEKCLQLAHLHSQAVDYAKTGVPARMPAHLRVTRWPHWAEPKYKARAYHSHGILGQIYDEVERVPFVPAWELDFDQRILDSCVVSDELLSGARQAKEVYDAAVRRIMTQFEITSEFEVFTTFVLHHHSEKGDYRFAEVIGEVSANLRQQHKELCYERAGLTGYDRSWSKLRPFIVAMYTVTAQEVRAAASKPRHSPEADGPSSPCGKERFESMPLMSFPWIFSRELGLIATGRDYTGAIADDNLPAPKRVAPQEPAAPLPQPENLSGHAALVPSLPGVSAVNGPLTVQQGDLLDLYHGETEQPVHRPSITSEHAAMLADAFSLALGDSEIRITKLENRVSDEGSATVLQSMPQSGRAELPNAGIGPTDEEFTWTTPGDEAIDLLDSEKLDASGGGTLFHDMPLKEDIGQSQVSIEHTEPQGQSGSCDGLPTTMLAPNNANVLSHVHDTTPADELGTDAFAPENCDSGNEIFYDAFSEPVREASPSQNDVQDQRIAEDVFLLSFENGNNKEDVQDGSQQVLQETDVTLAQHDNKKSLGSHSKGGGTDHREELLKDKSSVRHEASAEGGEGKHGLRQGHHTGSDDDKSIDELRTSPPEDNGEGEQVEVRVEPEPSALDRLVALLTG